MRSVTRWPLLLKWLYSYNSFITVTANLPIQYCSVLFLFCNCSMQFSDQRCWSSIQKALNLWYLSWPLATSMRGTRSSGFPKILSPGLQCNITDLAKLETWYSLLSSTATPIHSKNQRTWSIHKTPCKFFILGQAAFFIAENLRWCLPQILKNENKPAHELCVEKNLSSYSRFTRDK